MGGEGGLQDDKRECRLSSVDLRAVLRFVPASSQGTYASPSATYGAKRDPESTVLAACWRILAVAPYSYSALPGEVVRDAPPLGARRHGMWLQGPASPTVASVENLESTSAVVFKQQLHHSLAPLSRPASESGAQPFSISSEVDVGHAHREQQPGHGLVPVGKLRERGRRPTIKRVLGVDVGFCIQAAP
jgi:hypothetical protein